MQLQNILLTSFLALGASAVSSNSNATDIAPAVQNRIAKIDLGYQQTYLLLNHLADNTDSVSADVSLCTNRNTRKDIITNLGTIPGRHRLLQCHCQHRGPGSRQGPACQASF